MDAIKASIKRLGRVIIGGIVAGGIGAFQTGIESEPYYVFVAPLIIAGVSALGKWIREKWDIGVPF